MKLLKLIPDNTKIPFTKWRWWGLGLTTLSLVIAIVALITPGLNFGVDFKGGISIEVEDSEPINLEEVRGAVGALNIGSYKVQTFGAPNIVLVVVDPSKVIAEAAAAAAAGGEDAPSGDAAVQEAKERVENALATALGEGVNFRGSSAVGPTVSGELVQKGLMAVAFAIVMMLVYIGFRFQWQWGVGAVIGVVHDIVIVVGIYALCQFEFNLATIAAVLTVIGYSVNDTVVVYDRIRENLRKYKKMPLAELIDLSLNETLTRTVVTGGTTIMALIALVIFGGEVLRGFSILITLGILVGTYSSLFVASPYLLLAGVRRDAPKAEAAPQTA